MQQAGGCNPVGRQFVGRHRSAAAWHVWHCITARMRPDALVRSPPATFCLQTGRFDSALRRCCGSC